MKKLELKKIDMTKIDIKGSVNKMTAKIKTSCKRPLAMAIAAALIISAAGAGTYSVIAANREKNFESIRAYVNSEDLQEQDETVYVIADADGGVKKVIVSDWQKDSSKNKNIADIKSLDELEKSDAENGYSLNADTASSWDANDDSYYQSVSTGENLPVDVKLSYSLDGQKMTANEIAGKSGKVTIRFDYTNNQKQTVSIDGKDTDIYVPFTVVTGTILDGAAFSNVTVSNGKVISDGSRNIVMGFALPGMQESLGLDGDSLDLPNYVEITADVTNFELTTTLTMVSNDFFNEAVSEAEEKKNESKNDLSLDSLSAGINQLVNGSAALYDGTSQLLDKSSLLIDGVQQLADGGKELKDGVITVDQALRLICSNNAQLQSGADRVFNTLLAQTQSSIPAEYLPEGGLTIANYHDTLNGILSQAKSNLSSQSQSTVQQVSAGLAAQMREKFAAEILSAAGGTAAANSSDPDTQSVTNSVLGESDNSIAAEVSENVTTESTDITTDDTAAEPANENTDITTDESVANNTGENAGSNAAETPENGSNEEVPPSSAGTAPASGDGAAQSYYDRLTAERKAEVDAKLSAWMNSEAFSQTVNSYISGNDEIQSQLASAQNSIQALELALQNLDTFCQFYQGIYDYTNGVQQVCDGTGKLKDGASELSDGLTKLQDSSGALVDGISQLNDGAMQLSEGMQQLSVSNLAKLLGASSGVSLADVNARFDAMRDVSAAYNSYTGSNNEGGSVKFIYRTDSVTADSSK